MRNNKSVSIFFTVYGSNAENFRLDIHLSIATGQNVTFQVLLALDKNKNKLKMSLAYHNVRSHENSVNTRIKFPCSRIIFLYKKSL